jgi:hypothetical protein
MFRPHLALILGLALVSRSAGAQELEPRLYSNSPVGTSFLIAGYAYAQGGLSVDPSLPLTDAQLKIHSGFLAYARALDLWGMSGKLDLVVPYFKLSGTALLEGQPVERRIHGLGDARLRFSVNLYGAPALSTKQFAGYKRDLVIGAGVQVSVPTGQYDASRAINLGANRWWIKPQLGFSKALGPVTLDVTADATFFTENENYFGGKHLTQAPIYAAQASASFDFGGGIWGAVGTTYYRGGRRTVDDHVSDVELGNLRAGALLALPVSRQHSIKLAVSRGFITRTGSDFLTAGIAWQVRWGGDD